MNSHHGNNNEQWQNFCNDTVLYYATRNILYKDKKYQLLNVPINFIVI
jgi:hypothetical protein